MGYIRHHAIVVTANDYNDDIEQAHEKAKEIFGELVSEIITSKINGYQSFFIAPDGSKEFWTLSDEHDEKRSEFIKYLKSKAYVDGSSNLRYAELYYGDDERESAVVRHN